MECYPIVLSTFKSSVLPFRARLNCPELPLGLGSSPATKEFSRSHSTGKKGEGGGRWHKEACLCVMCKLRKGALPSAAPGLRASRREHRAAQLASMAHLPPRSCQLGVQLLKRLSLSPRESASPLRGLWDWHRCAWHLSSIPCAFHLPGKSNSLAAIGQPFKASMGRSQKPLAKRGMSMSLCHPPCQEMCGVGAPRTQARQGNNSLEQEAHERVLLLQQVGRWSLTVCNICLQLHMTCTESVGSVGHLGSACGTCFATAPATPLAAYSFLS